MNKKGSIKDLLTSRIGILSTKKLKGRLKKVKTNNNKLERIVKKLKNNCNKIWKTGDSKRRIN